MRVAFDSRPVADPEGVGRYSRRLLAALGETAAASDQLVQAHRPSALAAARNADVFHAPWIDGAMLHSPCPMVVTIHDLAALKRRSERLRCGGLHLRMRRLALQRAVQVIVPNELVATEAVAELGLVRERVTVVPTSPDGDWHDVARATWGVYARAVAATKAASARPAARLGARTRSSLLRPQ
ncbi:MAG TPA: glycosyltransferase [Solirubrobacteraceae bacterium]|nr:glycosyltransferase [Solirubrobacteraceae bacterium]